MTTHSPGNAQQLIDLVRQQLNESARVKQRTAQESGEVIVRAAQAVASAFQSGHKVLLCGNGGSAADSQHIAAEFVGRLGASRDRAPWPAIALTTDTSALTAISNDFGFDAVFSRQVEAIGNRGDVLIAFSTSGNSRNVLSAVTTASSLGLVTVGFLGGTGGALAQAVDIPVIVPSDDTQRIQEGHIAIGHVICEVVEAILLKPVGASVEATQPRGRS
ncbi:MAG: D-sedoheptulose 7-phosphate isomerase [Chloroflexi bacterium]|nr:D-sedoheptulose 7-phosphate isomerase [Chloroflexota bacterium]